MALELEERRHQQQTQQQSLETSQEPLQSQNSSPEARSQAPGASELYPSSGMQAPLGIQTGSNNSQAGSSGSTNSEGSEAAASETPAGQHSEQQSAASQSQVPAPSQGQHHHRGSGIAGGQQNSPHSSNNSSSQGNTAAPQNISRQNTSTQPQPTQLSTPNSTSSQASQDSSTPQVQVPTDNAKDSEATPMPQIEAPEFDKTSDKSIFAADEDSLDNLDPFKILGTTPDGQVLYETDAPETSQKAAKSGAPVQELSDSDRDNVRDEQKSEANSALAKLPPIAEEKIQTIDQLETTIQPKIDSAQNDAVTAIQNAQQTSRTNLISQIDQMRPQMLAKAEQIKTDIIGSHINIISSIQNDSNTARQNLQTGHDTALKQLIALESGLDAKIDGPMNQAHKDCLQVGQTAAARALEIGNQKATEFQKQSAPKGSNAVTKTLNKIDGDSYENNWRQAKVEAAHSVAQQFHDNAIKAASKIAQKQLEGKERLRQQMQHQIDAAKRSLEAQFNQSNQQIDTLEQQYINSANSNLYQQLGEVDSTLEQNLTDLDVVKTAQLGVIDSAATSQLGAVRKEANTQSSKLKRQVTAAKAGVNYAVAQLNAQMTSGDETPAPGVVESTVEQVKELFEENVNQAVTQLQIGIDKGVSQVSKSGQDGANSINDVANQAVSAAQEVVNQSGRDLDGVKASADDSFNQLQSTSSQTINQAASDATNALSTTASGMTTTIERKLNRLQGVMSHRTNTLNSKLQSCLAQEPAEIESAASKAASQVQPGWKSFLSFAATTAIDVAVFAAVIAAPELSIPALLAIGAANGVADRAIDDAFSGHMSSPQEYLEQAGIGAATVGAARWLKVANLGKIAGRFGIGAERLGLFGKNGVAEAASRYVGRGARAVGGVARSIGNRTGVSAALSRVASAAESTRLKGPASKVESFLGQELNPKKVGDKLAENVGFYTSEDYRDYNHQLHQDAENGKHHSAGEIARESLLAIPFNILANAGISTYVGEPFSQKLKGEFAEQTAKGITNISDKVLDVSIRPLGKNVSAEALKNFGKTTADFSLGSVASYTSEMTKRQLLKGQDLTSPETWARGAGKTEGKKAVGDFVGKPLGKSALPAADKALQQGLATLLKRN
ncbi:MAG: hypothetical protein QNJ54_21725 [Prochloraceae cyanobacterium]|nr:hypothetical protein [Prochloraceae cyanobacterium]